MSVEVVKCPACGQKLGVQAYVTVGTELVCANVRCLTNLRIVKRKPFTIERVPIEQTYNVNDRPESYG